MSRSLKYSALHKTSYGPIDWLLNSPSTALVVRQGRGRSLLTGRQLSPEFRLQTACYRPQGLIIIALWKKLFYRGGIPSNMGQLASMLLPQAVPVASCCKPVQTGCNHCVKCNLFSTLLLQGTFRKL